MLVVVVFIVHVLNGRPRVRQLGAWNAALETGLPSLASVGVCEAQRPRVQ